MLNRLRAAVQPSGSGRSDRSRGILGSVNLYVTLVIAFALFAVIELTRTWFGAQHISSNLQVADTRLQPIKRNTEQIQLLYRTSDLTAGILQAAKPLDQQAGRVNRTANDIQANVESIQDTAVTINSRVHDITATARDINVTAGRLLATVESIEDTAGSIESNVRGINSKFAALLPVTQRINGEGFPDPIGVDSIVRNADKVKALAADIDADLDDVLVSVNAVGKHTASILRSLPVTDLDDILTTVPAGAVD